MKNYRFISIILFFSVCFILLSVLLARKLLRPVRRVADFELWPVYIMRFAIELETDSA